MLVALALTTGAMLCGPQVKTDLNIYFRDYVGLSDGQIKAIRGGKPVATTLRSRTPAEIFVFGAVYVNVSPDAYVDFSTNFDQLEKMSGYVAIRKGGIPPQFDDLRGFTFDQDDINALRKCKPGDCEGSNAGKFHAGHSAIDRLGLPPTLQNK